ncbi:MAG: tRNA glutamyl-Q(34) synthetase GluQRS [Gammaproteobacteria bacterium]|nr:tRNA glutamyl-Q(34) synthetase GluQRS [Gammaproteobacteria bacterium]MBT8110039.1 tRNA glutamyl-Q(34) synthetase GluQRS [Gammaproteobacteria bacterium]NND46718.1 tRNA glutamyl-Q(34) synthetase GluQRS [Woeseiaceae bacterium]NNL44743.1 tRNA glutamyl-Q(34) synthetase GluQRS [Woeseiaceae bacterium]
MLTRESATYVGRFAPSPTGPLHFGSLVAAVASYLQAKARAGQWLLRIEDIDPPREQPGATDAILRALEQYGFEWHGDVIYQSRSQETHEVAIQSLLERSLAYPCGCSRRDLADAPRGSLGTIYPGTCRDGCDAEETAIRLRTTHTSVSFVDGLQGLQSQELERESGDFIIRRRDGLIAYHLAVVVDDAIEGITEIVRGIDLMDSTPRQIWLQQLLGYPTPNYIHIPVVTHPNGDKLSKLTGAAGIPELGTARVLVAALIALQQEPPEELRRAGQSAVWQWAIENWCLDAMQGQTAVSTDSEALAGLGDGLW